MQNIAGWLGSHWFEIIVAGTAVLAAWYAAGSRKEARKSSAAATTSAEAAMEAQLLSKAEYHRARTPKFKVQLEMLGEQADIPSVRIEYKAGEDLASVDIAVEAAQSVRQLFYAAPNTQTSEARVRRGDVRHLRVTPPDENGGRAVIVLSCRTAAGEQWTVRETIDMAPDSQNQLFSF